MANTTQHRAHPPFSARALRAIAAVLAALTVALPAVAADYDITSFGAVANDGLSDLAAIQAAIDAASVGDRVIIPAGVFHVTDSIRPVGGITLVGALYCAGKDYPGLAQFLGFFAIVMATTNVVGGFLVTDRMLGMFGAKKEKKS